MQIAITLKSFTFCKCLKSNFYRRQRRLDVLSRNLDASSGGGDGDEHVKEVLVIEHTMMGSTHPFNQLELTEKQGTFKNTEA
eukprot:3876490-Amphidinium_carterae.1